MPNQKHGNLWMKILSVAIAFLIWLLVTYINDPVVTRRFSNIEVKVTHENVLEQEGYTYDIIQGETVTVSVKGNRKLVNALRSSDLEATADLRNLSLTNAVPIEVTSKRDANNLEITLGSVSTMRISLDKMTSTSVAVDTDYTGTPADGYAVGKVSASPNLIRVEGPESALEDVKTIQVSIDVSNADEDVTETLTPVAYDSEGNVVTSNRLTFDTDSIEVTASIWQTKEVSVNVTSSGTVADGYKLVSFDYEPKQIEVAAPEETLKDLKEIDLGDVSVDGKKEDYEENIELTDDVLPDGVVVAGNVSDIKVKAVIEKLANHTLDFKESDLDVRNNTEKYKVSYSNANEYAIVVNCTDSEAETLKIRDFDPWIDLSGLEEGEHDVRVHVKEVDGVTVDSTPTITVTLSK